MKKVEEFLMEHSTTHSFTLLFLTAILHNLNTFQYLKFSIGKFRERNFFYKHRSDEIHCFTKCAEVGEVMKIK